MIIGKHGVFIRETVNKQSQTVQKRYEGLIIDKFSGRDKFDLKIYVIDFYQVLLSNGVCTHFACTELVQLVQPSEKEISS